MSVISVATLSETKQKLFSKIELLASTLPNFFSLIGLRSSDMESVIRSTLVLFQFPMDLCAVPAEFDYYLFTPKFVLGLKALVPLTLLCQVVKRSFRMTQSQFSNHCWEFSKEGEITEQ